MCTQKGAFLCTVWASDHDGIRATNEQEPTAKRAAETETQSTFELLKKDCSWHYCKRIRNWKHNEHLSFSPKDCVHGSDADYFTEIPPWGKITRDLHLDTAVSAGLGRVAKYM